MYTIKDIAEITEENEHTIRYYAKLGLFPNISRDKYNSRVFTDDDLDDVRLVIALADTGMPLDKVKEFMDYEREGDEDFSKRSQLLKDHVGYARNFMIKLQKEIQMLEWKAYQYTEKSRSK